ncbi:MAG: hypothetical protein U0992_21740 [Planctomycetaceae bacterium]
MPSFQRRPGNRSLLDDIHKSRLFVIPTQHQQAFLDAPCDGALGESEAVRIVDGDPKLFDLTTEPDAARPGRMKLLSNAWPANCCASAT